MIVINTCVCYCFLFLWWGRNDSPWGNWRARFIHRKCSTSSSEFQVPGSNKVSRVHWYSLLPNYTWFSKALVALCWTCTVLSDNCRVRAGYEIFVVGLKYWEAGETLAWPYCFSNWRSLTMWSAVCMFLKATERGRLIIKGESEDDLYRYRQGFTSIFRSILQQIVCLTSPLWIHISGFHFSLKVLTQS
jgi:hypothetical protein